MKDSTNVFINKVNSYFFLLIKLCIFQRIVRLFYDTAK